MSDSGRPMRTVEELQEQYVKGLEAAMAASERENQLLREQLADVLR